MAKQTTTKTGSSTQKNTAGSSGKTAEIKPAETVQAAEDTPTPGVTDAAANQRQKTAEETKEAVVTSNAKASDTAETAPASTSSSETKSEAMKPSSSRPEVDTHPKSAPEAKTSPATEAVTKSAATGGKAESSSKSSPKTRADAASKAGPKAKTPPKAKHDVETQNKPDMIAAPADQLTEKASVAPTITGAKASSKASSAETFVKRPGIPDINANGTAHSKRSSTTPVLPVIPAADANESVSDTKNSGLEHSSSAKTDRKQSPAIVNPQADRFASGTGAEPVYQEPQTPFIVPFPEVAQATSISPQLPSEKLEQRARRVDAPDSQELPIEAEAPGPVSEMPAHAESAPHYDQPGPNYPHMYVVQITPELAPLAKVGGLADVVTGLSRELEWRGHSVEIILPKYDCMHYDHIWGLCKTYDDLWVPWYNGHIHCTVWFGFVHGRKCFFIEPHSQDNFFNRGSIYGFKDDVLRYAFFCRAALEFLWKAGKRPDVIHCHDWQTALVPVFLYEIYQHLGLWHPRVCFTIHNFKHQGLTGGFLLNATGLHRPEYYFHYDRLLDNHIPHALNLMKGGIVYSNFVTTVSPRYAGETKDGGQGFGLEPTLHRHHYKFGGVVNGIDYDTWNPEIDPYIAAPFTLDKVDHKYVNKRALRDRLLLADNEKPIIAFVGRLDPQKGLDLVRHALFYSLNHRAQFVLLGSSPERDINGYFWELKRHLNDSPDCHIEVGFDEGLAHLIYAGADMIVVPSLFEPCGLTQLIAMQYGTIPIVREVGGLADTVFDKDHAHYKALHERNGYVFRDYNNQGLESALSRAIDCYYQFPEHFRELIQNAMRYDYSWKYPGQHYLNIYDYIRNK